MPRQAPLQYPLKRQSYAVSAPQGAFPGVSNSSLHGEVSGTPSTLPGFRQAGLQREGRLPHRTSGLYPSQSLTTSMTRSPLATCGMRAPGLGTPTAPGCKKCGVWTSKRSHSAGLCSFGHPMGQMGRSIGRMFLLCGPPRDGYTFCSIFLRGDSMWARPSGSFGTELGSIGGVEGAPLISSMKNLQTTATPLHSSCSPWKNFPPQTHFPAQKGMLWFGGMPWNVSASGWAS